MRPLPIPRIDPNALPRDRSLLDPGPLPELARSIAASGLHQPVEVWRRASPRPPYLYGLISGYRFTGPEARKGGLVDDVLDEVERVFGLG